MREDYHNADVESKDLEELGNFVKMDPADSSYPPALSDSVLAVAGTSPALQIGV